MPDPKWLDNCWAEVADRYKRDYGKDPDCQTMLGLLLYVDELKLEEHRREAQAVLDQINKKLAPGERQWEALCLGCRAYKVFPRCQDCQLGADQYDPEGA